MTISRRWIEEWAALYPKEYDNAFKPLHGKSQFDRKDVERVLDWKLRGLWSPQAKRSLAKNSPQFIREATRRAFAMGDELGALQTLKALKGVGDAVASAILMVHEPLRYTVADRNAWHSLMVKGYLGRYRNSPWAEAWVPYLATCRKLAIRFDVPLRQIDHALWKANGSMNLP